MSLQDLFIAPLVFILLYLIIDNYKNRTFGLNSNEGHLFMLAFIAKCIGAIALGMIYQFYYDGGDTFNYFDNSNHVHDAIVNDPIIGLKILFGESGKVTNENYKYASNIYFYSDSGSFFVVRVCALFSLLTFKTYSGIALLFALTSFSGIWCIYTVFKIEYPYLKKYLKWGILFLPSMIFWGSGIMKDSLCIAAIGWLFYGIYFLVVLKKSLVKSLFLIFLGSFFLFNIKLYILLSILPAIMIWLSVYFNKMLNPVIRIISFPIILLTMAGIGYLMINNLSSESEKYSLDKIQETSKVTSFYLRRISDQGAAYSLSSNFDGTVGSTIRLAPEAIVASFFRPFLWESRNIVMLISGLENFTILLLFLRGVYLLFVSKKFKIRNNKIMLFCMIFSVIFAIGIGLTTFNFGALVRYKLPFLPFLLTTLIVWNFKSSAILKLMRRKRINDLRSKILADKLT